MIRKICKKCVVHGVVQGVFFRASTQRQAAACDVSGYAKNLADGSVEVLLCGTPNNVEQMLVWLHQGPPAADVSQVEIEDLPFTVINGFSTA